MAVSVLDWFRHPETSCSQSSHLEPQLLDLILVHLMWLYLSHLMPHFLNMMQALYNQLEESHHL